MWDIVTLFVPGRNSRLQQRRFREFRNSVTDIENNSLWGDCALQHYTLKKGKQESISTNKTILNMSINKTSHLCTFIVMA